MSLLVCPGDFFFLLLWIAVWPIFGKETVLSVFHLRFDCGAVALNTSFFPSGGLDGRR